MHTRREIKYHIYSQILNKNAVQSLINILFVCRITPQLQQNLLLYSIPGPSSAAGYAQVHLQGGSFRPSQYLHQHSSADSVPLKFIRYPFPPTVGFLFLACQQQREKKKNTHTIKASYCSSQLAVLLPLVYLAVMYLCLCICIPLFLGARYTKKQGRAKPAAYCSQGAPAAVPSCGRSQLLQPHDLLCLEE